MTGPIPDEEGEDFITAVGYHIRVPWVDTEVGQRLMGPTQRYRWAEEIAEKIQPTYPDARAVVQDETTDHFGADTCWVIVWMQVAGEDIESARQLLRAEGYWVSEISIHYEPAVG